MANRRTLSDAEWNRIWKEKYEDPEYYSGIRVTWVTTAHVLERYAKGENAYMAARSRERAGRCGDDD